MELAEIDAVGVLDAIPNVVRGDVDDEKLEELRETDAIGLLNTVADADVDGELLEEVGETEAVRVLVSVADPMRKAVDDADCVESAETDAIG